MNMYVHNVAQTSVKQECQDINQKLILLMLFVAKLYKLEDISCIIKSALDGKS